MYQEITSNRRKSALLIALFVGVCAAVGYLYGYVTDTGASGIVFALVIAVGYSLVSWFWGDRVVLSASGAQEITSREQNSYLWNLVENLAITAGIPRPRIYVVTDPALNAFATGRDPQHASIAVTTGIVQALENEELEGVIAHELSHVKNEDTKVMLLAAVLVGVLSLIGNGLFRASFFGGRRSRNSKDDGGLGVALMIIGVIFIVLSPIIGQLIQLAISRQREYLADASGALLTRYPEGLARALEKIQGSSIPVIQTSTATNHLWIAEPTKASSSFSQRIGNLFSTHPPIADRIERLRKLI